jgi:hypothetical protein
MGETLKKIISLYQRNYDGDRLVRDEVTPGAEWVLAGEGIATVKIDGTCCLVRDGKLFKRYDAKKGRTPPDGWEPCELEANEHTGHWPGWLPVGDGPEDKWHREAWEHLKSTKRAQGGIVEIVDGTYELIGPKIQGNPYGFSRHLLIQHGLWLPGFTGSAPRDFESLRLWFANNEIEGVVWHHPDGRMVKIKRKDFGLPWPAKAMQRAS